MTCEMRWLKRLIFKLTKTQFIALTNNWHNLIFFFLSLCLLVIHSKKIVLHRINDSKFFGQCHDYQLWAGHKLSIRYIQWVTISTTTIKKWENSMRVHRYKISYHRRTHYRCMKHFHSTITLEYKICMSLIS